MAGPIIRELRELGYIEGRNLVLHVRHGEWEFDRLPALVADLVRRKVDLIVALREPAIQAATHATHTIPIAMVGSADPIGDQALEASLSPPCTRAFTASLWRRRITGGQRARLTPTLAFAPSTAPFRAHRRGSRERPDCLDAGPPAEVALIVPMPRETRDLWCLESYTDMR